MKLDYMEGKSKFTKEQEIDIIKQKIIEEVVKFK